jgi:tetratricopeptide (TPR) repeat protein
MHLAVLLKLVASISRAQTVFEQGVEASRRGDDDRALELLKQAVALDPNKADPHAYLGVAYMAISSRSAAISAILKDPEASASMSDSDRLAAAKMVTAVPESDRLAEVELRRALELDPTNAVALQWLVILANHSDADRPEAEKMQKMAEARTMNGRLALVFADSSLRLLAETQKLHPVNPARYSTGGLYLQAAELIQSNWHEVMQRANGRPLDPTGPLPSPQLSGRRHPNSGHRKRALRDHD